MFNLKKLNKLNILKNLYMNWGLGIGDWGLGIGFLYFYTNNLELSQIDLEYELK